jgi:High-temperature-induced dauer-formation protein
MEPSPIRIHLFEWTPLALGWYNSLLWGFIFQAEATISRGTSGVWSATGEGIKLFRVQEVGQQAPSLLNPRGAVDAVGANLVGRVQSLNLGNIGRSVSGGGGRNQPTVRDV